MKIKIRRPASTASKMVAFYPNVGAMYPDTWLNYACFRKFTGIGLAMGEEKIITVEDDEEKMMVPADGSRNREVERLDERMRELENRHDMTARSKEWEELKIPKSKRRRKVNHDKKDD